MTPIRNQTPAERGQANVNLNFQCRTILLLAILTIGLLFQFGMKGTVLGLIAPA